VRQSAVGGRQSQGHTTASVAGRTFDAIVVGSGASGGWAAKRLSEAGLQVCLLEAGRALTDADYKEHVPAYALEYRNRADELMRRTRPQQKDCYACREFNYDWFANDIDEPYTTPRDQPFAWMGRMRVVGGRTNVWGRQSYRLGDIDFKAASLDGHGVDWPLSYKDLAPYYDIVEEYVGITGINEGAEAVVPDGRFHPPMGMSCVEHAVRNRLRTQFGRTMTLGRSANITRPINGRAACHYCGPCEHGCATHSYFNAAFTTVADALKSGRTTMVTGAMVHQVLVDPSTNRARGVVYIDRATRQVREVFAKVVILGAQALESTRILLNSREGGLANGSGVLGKYLMDHISGGGASAEFPDLAGTVMGPNSPRRPNGIYLMRFRNLPGKPETKATDFLRGYGYQGGGSTGYRSNPPGFGAAYKAAMKETITTFSFGGFGECLPRAENHVAIDPDVVDAWGIPVLRVSMRWSDNEHAMRRDMAVQAAEMLDAMGGRNIQFRLNPRQAPGYGIHEVGTARMGADPKSSVLNQFQQTHEIPNLLVTDGAGFPSIACQNPTLTIMALTVRSCDHLLERLRTNSL
jgi:choline dehydrogenase-like flavoprotein